MFGMFSFIDTLLSKEMKDIIDDLPITNELAEALIGNNDKYNLALTIVQHLERGAWIEIQSLCGTLSMKEDELLTQYQASIVASNQFLQVEPEKNIIESI